MKDDFALNRKERGSVLKRGFLPKGYVVKRWIVWLSFLPAILILGIMLYREGLNENFYLRCPSDVVQCDNPFYNSCDVMDPSTWCADGKLRNIVCSEYPGVCMLQFLPSGFEIGQKPGFLYDWFFVFAAFPPLGAVVLNHFLFNRKFKFGKR